jgi:hypothetical protein
VEFNLQHAWHYIAYMAIFVRASHVDRQYTCLPTKVQWKFVEDVVERLRLYNDTTAIFFAQGYVAPNI